jgi:hypothetical protein
MPLDKLAGSVQGAALNLKNNIGTKVGDIQKPKFADTVKNLTGQLRDVGTQYEQNVMKGIAGVGDINAISTSVSVMELNVQFIKRLVGDFVEITKEVMRTPI